MELARRRERPEETEATSWLLTQLLEFQAGIEFVIEHRDFSHFLPVLLNVELERDFQSAGIAPVREAFLGWLRAFDVDFFRRQTSGRIEHDPDAASVGSGDFDRVGRDG